MSAMRYTVGLDLGMGAEPTALAVLERRRVEATDRPDQRRPPYALRHLQRFPPATGYPSIFDSVVTLLRTPPLPGAWLLADYTAVGRAVLRLLVEAMSGRVTCNFSGVALTAGREIGSPPSGGFAIAKPELVGTLQVLLQTKRLQVSRDLTEAQLLVRELQNYRPRVVLPKSDELLWREGAHDDLVLAVGLAAWGGEHVLPHEGRRERLTVWRT
jgi:hypothetical protein